MTGGTPLSSKTQGEFLFLVLFVFVCNCFGQTFDMCLFMIGLLYMSTWISKREIVLGYSS